MNSADRSKPRLAPAKTKPADRRPMNVTEKIFALHEAEGKGSVKPGEMIRVGVDWIMASDCSWHVSSALLLTSSILG